MDDMFASMFIEEKSRRRRDAVGPIRNPFPLALAPVQQFKSTPLTDRSTNLHTAARAHSGLFGRSRYASDFTVLRRIGKGGFGQVVEARNNLGKTAKCVG